MALILIEKLGTMKDKNGNYRKYGKFKCSFDNKEIIRRLDTIAKSCGCATNKLKSEAFFGEKNPQYGKKGVESPNFGRKRTDEQRKNISEAKKGNKNPMYGKNFTMEHRENIAKSHKGEKCFWYGKNFTVEHRENLSESHIGIQAREKHPNWQDGKSFEIYPQEFKLVKKSILERDNYQCQDPNCDGNHKKLHIHHIDYDKKNNNPENLITLCISCHMKTNYNRKYFTEFYNNLNIGRMMQNALDTRR